MCKVECGKLNVEGVFQRSTGVNECRRGDKFLTLLVFEFLSSLSTFYILHSTFNFPLPTISHFQSFCINLQNGE